MQRVFLQGLSDRRVNPSTKDEAAACLAYASLLMLPNLEAIRITLCSRSPRPSTVLSQAYEQG